MEPEEADGDDEPRPALLPPDDRLWRHPSEVAAGARRADEPRRAPVRPLRTVAVLSALVGSLLTIGVVAATGGLRQSTPATPAVERIAVHAGSLSTAVGAGASSASRVAAGLRAAVVTLRVERRSGRTSGSGVIFRSDGHVLTVHHLVDGADAITAVMADGRRAPARLAGADPTTDIAVLQVEDWPSAPTAPMGSAAGLLVGQDVMAVTSDGTGPVVKVRALGRHLERGQRGALSDMIETDAPLGAAASGGALVDAAGAVVGITNAADGLGAERSRSGFATPIDHARSVANQLLTTGKVVRVWMGVEGRDLDPATAARLGLDGGAVVTRVRTPGPAGDAGLAAEDVITSVDSAPVRSMAALRVLLRGRLPGDVVRLRVIGRGGARELAVKLVERAG